MSQYAAGSGDNIEFTASAIGDYEIFLQHNENTSANDTEFKKYPDVQFGVDGFGATAKKFLIRTDKNTDLVEINGIAFTNPITIVTDKAHREERSNAFVFKLKIRTSATDTMIKVRWF